MVESLHVLEEAPRETIPADFEKYLAEKRIRELLLNEVRAISNRYLNSYYAGLKPNSARWTKISQETQAQSASDHSKNSNASAQLINGAQNLS